MDQYRSKFVRECLCIAMKHLNFLKLQYSTTMRFFYGIHLNRLQLFRGIYRMKQHPVSGFHIFCSISRSYGTYSILEMQAFRPFNAVLVSAFTSQTVSRRQGSRELARLALRAARDSGPKRPPAASSVMSATNSDHRS